MKKEYLFGKYAIKPFNFNGCWYKSLKYTRNNLITTLNSIFLVPLVLTYI